MTWQDVVLGCGSVGFIVALLPMVFSAAKPPLRTSLAGMASDFRAWCSPVRGRMLPHQLGEEGAHLIRLQGCTGRFLPDQQVVRPAGNPLRS